MYLLHFVSLVAGDSAVMYEVDHDKNVVSGKRSYAFSFLNVGSYLTNLFFLVGCESNQLFSHFLMSMNTM